MYKQRLALLALLAPFTVLVGANSAPEAITVQDTLPAPRDIPWPGTIVLSVDATDVTHGIFQVTETIPIQAGGPLVLLHPKSLPGNHALAGPITKLAGLKTARRLMRD